jgi:hypothetical protein
VFEIGRRFKIMNPDRMRGTYGKLMHMLQDCVASRAVGLRGGVKPILTVSRFLDSRGALDVLSDPDIQHATIAVTQESRTRQEVEALVASKAAA